MKCAIILPDGASDQPIESLGNQTPLMAANIPHMDEVAMTGRIGRSVTIPPEFTPGTDVGTLSLFGYDPHRYYSGRAPIEAAAQGLQVADDELIFRSNFVSIIDGVMKDFTAGHVAQSEADALNASLNEHFKSVGCQFYSGVSYRNLMVFEKATDVSIKCQPPHDITDQPVAGYWPVGDGADRVQRVMDEAARLLRDHDVNHRRHGQGKLPVTNIWLWGQGKPVTLESFASRWGLSGAVITGVDIIRGLARLMGMSLIRVEGATGYIDTNYDGKGMAAIEALDEYDLVVVHVEAPDEAGHLGDAREKVLALERMDQYVVGPVLEKLRSFDQWKVLIAADHATPVSTKAHHADPPPFCFAGSGIEAVEHKSFTELDSHAGPLIDPGWHLMRMFMSY